MSNVLLNELKIRLPEREDVEYEMGEDKMKVKIRDDNGFEVRPSGGITCYPETVYDDI